jgi:hypothetical protein
MLQNRIDRFLGFLVLISCQPRLGKCSLESSPKFLDRVGLPCRIVLYVAIAISSIAIYAIEVYTLSTLAGDEPFGFFNLDIHGLGLASLAHMLRVEGIVATHSVWFGWVKRKGVGVVDGAGMVRLRSEGGRVQGIIRGCGLDFFLLAHVYKAWLAVGIYNPLLWVMDRKRDEREGMRV